MRIGILHPGEMGGAIGARLLAAGHSVWWASAGRSAATAARAAEFGDSGTVAGVAKGCEMLLSVCPPHAAVELAEEVARAGFGGLYVDANAVAPETAERVAAIAVGGGATYVDGGIVGPPPEADRGPRLFLSGTRAGEVGDAFAATPITAIALDADPFAASALKMAYAGWTKGSAALLLAVREAAAALGIEAPLREEWQRSQPELDAALERAERDRQAKGWRWQGEMGEIAATFAALGLPDGFHRAAAEVFAAADEERGGEPGRG